jgi:hypothetical protein
METEVVSREIDDFSNGKEDKLIEVNINDTYDIESKYIKLIIKGNILINEYSQELKKKINIFEDAQESIDREILLDVVKTIDIHYKDGSRVYLDENMQKKSGKNLEPKIININNLFDDMNISKKELIIKAREISLNKYVNSNEVGYSTFKNIDTGTNFNIGRSGINDTFSSHKNRDVRKFNTANILENIGEEGIYLVTTSTPDDTNNIKYHHFITIVKLFDLDGNAFAHSVIREFTNDKTSNNSFYYHRLEYLDGKKGGSQGIPAKNIAEYYPVENAPFYDNNIAHNNDNVKLFIVNNSNMQDTNK